MKKKSLTMLLTGLLAMSLTGVGFASWIIVQGDTEEPTGSVAVETVEKKELTVTAAFDEGNDADGTNDNVFSFGPNAAGNTGWLRNETMEQERLTLTLDVTIANFDDYGSGATITAEAVGNKENYNKAVEEGYITAIKVGSYTASASFSVDISVGWGSKFGGETPKNPFEYYNATTQPSDALITEAETNLKTLYSYLNGVTFKVTVKSY